MGVRVGWTHAWGGGGTLGQGLDFFFFFFKNDNLFPFQSRTEDLIHNVCDYVLD